MATKTDIARAKTLIEVIKHHDKLYFTDNAPEISDEAYDALWFELRELLEDNGVKKALRTTAMPLGEQRSALGKVDHLVPVLSLDKAKSDENLVKTLEKFERKHPSREGWTVEPKFDGLTIVIYRTNADEPVFVTRGAGQKGEDVTAQFRGVEPTWSAALRMSPGDIVKGEAVVPKATFDALHQSEYANPRNLASGAVRTKEPGRVADVGVEFIAYEVLASKTRGLCELEDVDVDWLQSLGFETTPMACINAGKLAETLPTLDFLNPIWRKLYEHPLDGVVIKPRMRPAKLEWNGHHVVGQLAVKYPPDGAETTLRSVEWTRGKSGKLTPVAEFDEVSIHGVTTSKASLGSYGVFKRLDLHVGDKLYVVLANDVIPHVDANLGGGGDAVTPPAGEVRGQHLFVEHARPAGDVLNAWLSTLGVRGYGAKFCAALADAGHDAIDALYGVSSDGVARATRCSSERAEQFVADVASTRDAPLEKLLEAFRFDGVGGVKARKACEDVESLVDAAVTAGIGGERLELVERVAKAIGR